MAITIGLAEYNFPKFILTSHELGVPIVAVLRVNEITPFTSLPLTDTTGFEYPPITVCVPALVLNVGEPVTFIWPFSINKPKDDEVLVPAVTHIAGPVPVVIACSAGEELFALVISNLPAFPAAEGFSPKIDGLFPLATPCIADPCPDTFPFLYS